MICPHCGMDAEKIETSRIEIEKDDQGRMKVWTEITEDQDGVEILRRVDTYSYFETGEVKKIRSRRSEVRGREGTEVGDQKSEVKEPMLCVSDREVVHYVDGRRPEVRSRMSEVGSREGIEV